jgi:hypothetical protein
MVIAKILFREREGLEVRDKELKCNYLLVFFCFFKVFPP